MEFKLVRTSGSKGLGDLLKAQNATIIDFTGRESVTDPLTDLLRKVARRLLAAAIILSALCRPGSGRSR